MRPIPADADQPDAALVIQPPAAAPAAPLVIQAPPPTPSGTALKVTLAAFLGAMALLVLAVALTLLLLAMQISHAESSLAGGIGQTAQSAGHAIEQGAGAVVQSIQDARDPLHPPRYAIQQDPHFDALQTLHSGDVLGEAGGYRYVIVGIAQRPENLPAPQRLYAHIQRSLITPKVTKILGVVVHSDSETQDYALYQGQEFALNGRDYKVNDLSAEDDTLTILRFRDDADASGPLVFGS